MIIETILNLIAFVVLGIISLFPKFPTLKFDFLNGVIRMFSMIDLFVSLRVLISCLVIIFIVLNAQIIWSGIMWVVRKIPFLD